MDYLKSSVRSQTFENVQPSKHSKISRWLRIWRPLLSDHGVLLKKGTNFFNQIEFVRDAKKKRDHILGWSSLFFETDGWSITIFERKEDNSPGVRNFDIKV